ncbi:tyrosine-type recombinase/integrase [Eubacterium sp. AB3007]|uniref:tyrosine-type recombinase/integrase n=1 Tax=Eubacterium sp. AB3007 TaxID=1392487 RepID=UPI0004816E74|nr:tyrosine-type recombinase/integrase [Eubacterium sp. AB3007]
MAGKNGQKLLRGSITFEGKRHYVSGYTREEVVEKKALLRKELEEGSRLRTGRMTVREWSQEWLHRYKEGKINDRYYRDLEGILNNWVLPAIGGYPLSKVKQMDVQGIMDGLSGKSASLVNKVYNTLNSLFQKAEYNNLIRRSPVIDIIKPVPAIRNTRRSLTDEERKVLVETASEFVGGEFYLIMLYAGLRPGEVAALKWKHLDFDADIIHVRDMVKSDDRIADATDRYNGKTIHATRDVFLSLSLKSALLRLREERSPRSEDYVAPQRKKSRQNMHHTKSSLRTMWESFRLAMHIHMGGKAGSIEEAYRDGSTGKRASVNRAVPQDDLVAADLVPYCLRHTFCTDLRAAGVPIEVAKDLMGHADISLTAAIYSHAEETSIAAAKKSVDELHSKKQEM